MAALCRWGFMAVKVISTFHRNRCRNRNRSRMDIKHSESDSFANVSNADRVKELSDSGLKQSENQ